MCLAIPGRVISIDRTEPNFPTGQVSFGGTIRAVNLAFVPEAKVGDYVNVHAGVAIGRMSEQDADYVLDLLEQLDNPGEAEESNDEAS